MWPRDYDTGLSEAWICTSRVYFMTLLSKEDTAPHLFLLTLGFKPLVLRASKASVRSCPGPKGLRLHFNIIKGSSLGVQAILVMRNRIVSYWVRFFLLLRLISNIRALLGCLRNELRLRWSRRNGIVETFLILVFWKDSSQNRKAPLWLYLSTRFHFTVEWLLICLNDCSTKLSGDLFVQFRVWKFLGSHM